MLFGLKVMAEGGFLADERCDEAIAWLCSKQRKDGGFPAEAKFWSMLGTKSHRSRVSWGPTGKTRSNEFVTADALWVLAQVLVALTPATRAVMRTPAVFVASPAAVILPLAHMGASPTVLMRPPHRETSFTGGRNAQPRRADVSPRVKGGIHGRVVPCHRRGDASTGRDHWRTRPFDDSPAEVGASMTRERHRSPL